MVELIHPPPDEFRHGLSSVIEGALAGGAPAPSWVAVDDGADAWVVEVCGRPPAERVRGVVAAAGDDALATAQRLGIGGAMWLPPSSLGALEAVTAAGAGDLPVGSDAAAVEMLESGAGICVVSFADGSFWRAQLGDWALARMLSELASALGTPAAILTWPALVVAGRDPGKIVEAWRELDSAVGRIAPTIVVLPLESAEPGRGILDAAYAALISGSRENLDGRTQPQPVHELPHGRRVGWWCLEEGRRGEEPGWFVVPVDITPTRCRWRLDGAEPSGRVAEVLTAEETSELDGVVAARIPGWASRNLRPGSPAGLLAARIAEAASRRGLPLWIPNVDDQALRFVLGLPGVIWVDGSAVPR